MKQVGCCTELSEDFSKLVSKNLSVDFYALLPLVTSQGDLPKFLILNILKWLGNYFAFASF